MGKIIDNIVIEHARIKYKNFEGRGDKYNHEGNINFCVILDDADIVYGDFEGKGGPELATILAEDGWNVKISPALDEGGKPTHYIQVKVKFNKYPPQITMITGNKRNTLDETSIKCLDYAEITNVDLIVRPYTYNDEGDIAAYVKSMYVTIFEDPLAKKYDIGPEDMPWNN